MDNKAIETLSISAVRNSIATCDYLSPFISDNDKEPSWDGFVYIYNDISKRKDKLIGRMPVQVKGIKNCNFDKPEISFAVKTSDLRNYLNDRGVVFFVVYISNEGLLQKIYYTELTPMKLRSILSEGEKQKTKSIKLTEFPNDGIKKATIFLNCWTHCQKQSSFIEAQLYTSEELEEKGVLEAITSTVSGFKISADPIKAFVESDVYLYARIKGSSIPQPLELIPSKIFMSTGKNATITVSGIPYYSSLTCIHSKGEITARIGESFSITYFEKAPRRRINYIGSDKLNVVVKDLDFMLAVLDAMQLEIDGKIIPIDSTNLDYSNFDIDQQRLMLQYYKKMAQVFNILGVAGDVKLSKLTQQDTERIDKLITAFIDKEPVRGFKQELPPVVVLRIATYKFALLFLPVEGQEGVYNIHDFFKTELDFQSEGEDGKKYETSPFVQLKPNDLLDISNIRFEALLPSFQRVKNNPYNYQEANMMLLNLLTAYDICTTTKKTTLLETAEDFAKWLLDEANEDDFLPFDIRCLNHLQVIRRQRDFSFEEIKLLCSITENNLSREDVMVGAYLLLGDQKAAKLHFENLDAETKHAFRDFPIYNFWIDDRQE